MMKNIIEIFLDQLEVKYTHSYITKLYNEHPHKYNMFGLFDILHSYNINAIGVIVENKDYNKLLFPCILHTNNGFAVALKIINGNIIYYWNGKKLSLPTKKFDMMWTGNAIMIDGDSDALEPNYISHLREERVKMFKKALFAIALCILIFDKISKSCHYYGFPTMIFMVLNILGIIPCTLLMEKQMYSESRLGDKVCSLFHQKDCNNILSSEKAKIWGISWAEIGLSFFITSLLSLAFTLINVNELSIISIFALFYTVWSIYYQWKVAKQWCVLCLLVQTIIVLMACFGLLTMIYSDFQFNAMYVIRFGITWFLLTIVLNLFFMYKKMSRKYSESIQKYQALKSNKKVFHTLLALEKFHDTTLNDSTITFGDINAKTRITVLTNPHCNPCAKTHKKIDKLLEKSKDKVCIQYIFSSFTEELKDSCRFLIAIRQKLGEQQSINVFNHWYSDGRYNALGVMKKWKDIDIHSISVKNEITRHENWKKRTGYSATPTILVNGYELPEEYDIDDISMILD